MAIQKPITVTAVKNALGVGSTDVGTLCTHAYVKHWSRFKPMDMIGITQDKRNTDTYLSQSNFWKGKQNIDYIPVTSYGSGSYLYKIQTCGLNFYAFTNWLDCLDTWLVTDADNETEISDNFAWDKPKGGANSPYRLGDFIGYDNTIGCQFWSSITADPNTPDSQLPKYNYQAAEPIDCIVMTYGGNGISLLELLGTIGASNISLRAIVYDEDNANLLINKASFGTPINNTSASISVTPTSTYCRDNNVFGIAYVIEFTAPISNTPTTLYMPITQRVDGGENTKVLITGDGKTRYGLQRFKCTAAPPASFSLVQLRVQYQNGWSDWMGIGQMNLTDKTNMLWLHFQATASTSTTNGFTFTTECVVIHFDYYTADWKSGTFSLDGQILSSSRIRITQTPSSSSSTSEFSTSLSSILIPKGQQKDVYIALPNAFTADGTINDPIPTGSTIKQMRIDWRAGESTDEWSHLSSYNLNIPI